MGNDQTEINDLNRREFLLKALQTAGVVALGSVAGASAAATKPARASAAARRIGISDAAYQKAMARAQALVGQMTLDEKISQLGSGAQPIPRLKVPGYNYYTGEALHGLTQVQGATSFPMPLGLSASWNPELVRKVYSAVSEEARAFDNRDHNGLSYYSPITLNLHRDPRWGRCGEAPGEDPCVASTFGVQAVRGMQGDDPNYLKATPCSKHFICNNTDSDRMAISATVDPRSFREFYTRSYRATILDGDVFAFMSAYSAINGIPCTADRFLLTDLLRGEWGFRGYVTSDCDAVYNVFNPHHYAKNRAEAAGMSISAGCDLDCGGTLQANTKAAVDQKLVSEADITQAVVRLFTVRYLLGLFDAPSQVSYTRIPFSAVDSPAHRALALEAARQSLVLLKNESHFLPLDKKKIKKIAVIGPMAGQCYLGGYSGSPKVRISPLQGISTKLGVSIHHPYIVGSDLVNSGGGVLREASSEGEEDIGFIGDGSWAEFPKVDFTGKTEIQMRVASDTTGGTIDVHLDSLNGPLACSLTVPGTGGWQNWIDIKAPISGITGKRALFLSFHGSGQFLFNIERIQLNPLSAAPVKQTGPQLVFAPGCGVTGDKDEKMFNDAVAAARGADVVVMVCGVNEGVDGEGRDRRTIELTGAQPELIKAVYAVNPKTVLVLSTNNSVAINWENQHLPAILCAVCAGQAQGTAIADALFGDYNPGGKLSFTWYRSLNDLPDFHDYTIRKGRTYMYFKGDPLYPFGHGLSYTTFELEHLKIGASRLGPSETAEISLTVTNTGNRAGAEVVQLYLTPPPSPVQRPIKQLVGFQRVELQPGERRKVVFELPFEDPTLWYWDESQDRFVCQAGAAKILVGNSSANILLTRKITLESGTDRKGRSGLTSGAAVKSTVV
jgi:beta-glucosidase